MKLRYTPTATSDVDGIFDYIAQRDPLAAEAVVGRIEEAIGRLMQFPYRGRVGRVVGTRELVVGRSPYVVAYKVSGDSIIVLSVLDGRRRWPEAF